MKKLLATTAILSILSTSAFAFGSNNNNTTTNNNPTANGGNASAGAAALSGAISGSKSGVKNSGNSESESGVYGSGNSANLNAQVDASRTSNKQKQDASSSNDISIGGDNYVEAKNVANAPVVLTPASNFDCTQVSGGGIQSTGSGVAANIASDSEACIALKLVETVKDLEPTHKGLQLSMLCTSKQAREGLEAHGIADKYCAKTNTYLGLKPIVSGVKEIILLPITFIKWVINA